MRWLFFILLGSNMLYFGWVSYLRPDAKLPVSRAGFQQGTEEATAPLQLLSEVESNKTAVAEVKTVDPAGQSDRILLGGFVDIQSIEALKQRMLSYGIAGQVARIQVEAGKEYWVYLSPLSSRAATLRLLRELQARKLDGFMISQGELANGISLGIFPQEVSARAVMDRVRSAGYEAQLKEISRNQDAYWYEIEPAGQRLLDEGVLSELIKDFPGLQHQQR